MQTCHWSQYWAISIQFVSWIYFVNIHFNIIFPSPLRSFKWPFFKKFYNQNSVYDSCFPKPTLWPYLPNNARCFCSLLCNIPHASLNLSLKLKVKVVNAVTRNSLRPRNWRNSSFGTESHELVRISQWFLIMWASARPWLNWHLCLLNRTSRIIFK
jgi:hypothetical protein